MGLPYRVGQVGKLETTSGPYIDTLGAAITGYRTAADAVTASDLVDGQAVVLTIYSGTTGAPTANFLMWSATWDNGNSRWIRIAELDTGGTIADEDDVSVYVSGVGNAEVIQIACSNSVSPITTGTAKSTFRMPFAMSLVTLPRASLATAPTGAAFIADINEGGSSILSTKLSVDATEKTSTTAATPAVLSDTELADDAEITIDFDQVGSTVAGVGVVITLIGIRG